MAAEVMAIVFLLRIDSDGQWIVAPADTMQQRWSEDIGEPEPDVAKTYEFRVTVPLPTPVIVNVVAQDTTVAVNVDVLSVDTGR